MKKEIENFTSATGWTSNGTIATGGINAHSGYIAGGLGGSLIFHVPTGNSGKYIKKTISVDVTGYDVGIIWIWSRNKERSQYLRSNDFYYKISFGGKAFYLPTFSGFGPVIFSLAGLTSLTKVEITALHNDDDYLIVSYCQAIKEELPLDIFNGVRDGLRALLDVQSAFSSGTVTCLANDTSITVAGSNYFLERYAVIKITDGNHTEYHQIIETDGLKNYKFSEMYDGTKMLYAYTNATVSIYFPVEFGVDSSELLLPGITIQGMTPDPILRGSTLESIIDSIADDGTASIRREDFIFKYNIMIDVDARHLEIMGELSKVVRRFITRQLLWVNGIDCEITMEQTPTYTEPIDPNMIVHKMQYILSVEYKESVFDRISVAITDDIRITTNIL